MEAVAAGPQSGRLGNGTVPLIKGDHGCQASATGIEVDDDPARKHHAADVALVRTEHTNDFHGGGGRIGEARVVPFQWRLARAFAGRNVGSVVSSVACAKAVSRSPFSCRRYTVVTAKELWSRQRLTCSTDSPASSPNFAAE